MHREKASRHIYDHVACGGLAGHRCLPKGNGGSLIKGLFSKVAKGNQKRIMRYMEAGRAAGGLPGGGCGVQ